MSEFHSGSCEFLQRISRWHSTPQSVMESSFHAQSGGGKILVGSLNRYVANTDFDNSAQRVTARLREKAQSLTYTTKREVKDK